MMDGVSSKEQSVNASSEQKESDLRLRPNEHDGKVLAQLRRLAIVNTSSPAALPRPTVES